MLSRNFGNYKSTLRNIPEERRPRPKNTALEWKPYVIVDESVLDNLKQP